MAQISKVEAQVELKCPADKHLEFFTTKPFLLAKASPDNVKSVQLLEGDGAVGSVLLWDYVLVVGNSETGKEKIEAIDRKNKSATFTVTEGNVLNHYKTFKFCLETTTKGQGCLVKWTIEYEKQNEATPAPNNYLELATTISKDIEAYLLKP